MRRLVTLPVVLILVVVAGCGGSAGKDRTEAGPASVAGAAPAKRKGLRLIKVGAFNSPVHVTAPPGDPDRVFVVEQAGRIRVIRNGKKLATPFLDIRRLVTAGAEQGLLSLAFAPDYATSKRFYVYYTANSGNQRVVEYTAASADRADAGSARKVLEMADQESNHNGGLLLFGPDGHLYIGTGDGGGAGDEHGRHGNGQNTGVLLGKLLRIDPAQSGRRAYTTPPDNPFANGGGRPEIYAYGLRNPWRFSFDRETDALSIGDVGQDAIEEIDFTPPDGARGKNFGWRVYEGFSRYTRESAPGAVKPVMTFRHSDGNCSITGGVVVRDHNVPAAYGRYLFGDYCKGDILSAKLKLPRVTSLFRTGLKVHGLASFGEDARGRVYLASTNGPVYRLASR
jgi:glucose/arabinose dehydrogenase